MSPKDKAGIEAIKKFLRVNQDALATEVAKDKGVNKVVSYAKVFSLLRLMTDKHIVTRREANGRDIRYRLNEGSYLVSVPEQLSDFRTYYVKLLEESRAKAFQILGGPSEGGGMDKYMRYTHSPLKVYAALSRIHYLYAAIVWPVEIKDGQTRKEVNNAALEFMVDIQSDIRDVFGFLGEEDIDWQIKQLIAFETRFFDIISPLLLFSYLLEFEQDQLHEHAKPVLDALWQFGLAAYSSISLLNIKLHLKDETILEENWLNLVKL
ncbi:MAG: hypothetical protein ACREBU_07395, partial [Nitrososphaera sp.]